VEEKQVLKLCIPNQFKRKREREAKIFWKKCTKECLSEENPFFGEI
jgi:hypothetical protein